VAGPTQVLKSCAMAVFQRSSSNPVSSSVHVPAYSRDPRCSPCPMNIGLMICTTPARIAGALLVSQWLNEQILNALFQRQQTNAPSNQLFGGSMKVSVGRVQQASPNMSSILVWMQIFRCIFPLDCSPLIKPRISAIWGKHGRDLLLLGILEVQPAVFEVLKYLCTIS
jgi:hypothetical protein